MIMNFAANMLGLDNAATPLGLKAMQELQELNPEADTATDSDANADTGADRDAERDLAGFTAPRRPIARRLWSAAGLPTPTPTGTPWKYGSISSCPTWASPW